MECQQSHDEPECTKSLRRGSRSCFGSVNHCTNNSDHYWGWKAEPVPSQEQVLYRVADGRTAAVTVCPLWFQSVRRGSTDTAAARPAPSACTAVALATTSLACVTACLDSLEPSAMKVQKYSN